MVWFVLAAQETPLIDKLPWYFILDMARYHQINKSLFIRGPIAVSPLVVVKHFLRWGEFRHVHVIHRADFSEKEPEVVSLSKSGELRDVV